jgi:hypothetical protein
MFMRVSSFLLSRAPTEQEIKEPTPWDMVPGGSVSVRSIRRAGIRLAGFLSRILRCYNRFAQSSAAFGAHLSAHYLAVADDLS